MALRQDGFGKTTRIMPKVNVDVPKSDEDDEEEEEEVNDEYKEGDENGQQGVAKQVELSLQTLNSNKHDQLKNKPDLIKLLHEIDDYQIFVPDSVVKYHLERAGCNVDPSDRKIVRIIGLAAQKFAMRIAESALTYNIEKFSRSKVHSGTNRKLRMVDISKAAADEGVKIHVSKRQRLK